MVCGYFYHKGRNRRIPPGLGDGSTKTEAGFFIEEGGLNLFFLDLLNPLCSRELDPWGEECTPQRRVCARPRAIPTVYRTPPKRFNPSA